jgi:hypothetical protein
MARKETVAWERSEPGTGPIPAYEDPSKDKSIATGSRRDSPPIAFEEINLFLQNYDNPEEGG